MPRTGVEPARLSALAPETSASTIPPPGLADAKLMFVSYFAKFFSSFFNIVSSVLLVLLGAECDSIVCGKGNSRYVSNYSSLLCNVPRIVVA